MACYFFYKQKSSQKTYRLRILQRSELQAEIFLFAFTLHAESDAEF